jgi:hypothetical protein
VLSIAGLAILMGRPRPADFVRLAQQLSARQPDAFRADQPPAKKRSSPSGGDAFSPLLGRVNPPTLATVLNEWFQAR